MDSRTLLMGFLMVCRFFFVLVYPILTIVHCYRSPLTSRAKWIWVVCILLTGPLACSFYGFFSSRSKSLKWLGALMYLLLFIVPLALALAPVASLAIQEAKYMARSTTPRSTSGPLTDAQRKDMSAADKAVYDAIDQQNIQIFTNPENIVGRKVALGRHVNLSENAKNKIRDYYHTKSPLTEKDKEVIKALGLND